MSDSRIETFEISPDTLNDMIESYLSWSDLIGEDEFIIADLGLELNEEGNYEIECEIHTLPDEDLERTSEGETIN